MASVGPALAIALELVAWASRRDRRARAAGLALVVVLFTLCLLGHNAAAEFRLARGVIPTAIDLRQGLGHRDFLTAELPPLLGGRFLAPNLVAAASALSILLRLRLRVALAERRAAHALGLAFGAALSLTLVFASRRAHAFYGRMHNAHALASPPAELVRGLVSGGGWAGSPAEIRRLLAEHEGAPGDAAEGARHMGFDPDAARRLRSGDCSEHPLARPLESEGGEPAIVSAARDVSRELFRDREAAPIVFHVSLESMRADDIHALEPHAPPEIAPFLDRVYSGAPAPAVAAVAAFAHAHQSGVRTSQALSAVMCGLGALPFNLSASRDLGVLPLRCLSDVLADAGFRARAFYGHDFVFDDMGTFLQSHHVSLHGRSSLPGDAPRGVWTGVSDAAVYAAAEGAAEGASEGAQYNFILTLSHHAPYTAPEDLSPSIASSLDGLCRSRSLEGESCARLKTLRYADDALGRFIERVGSSRNASRTLVVVSADHTVHQSAPWTRDDRPSGITQVPVFVWVPDAMARRVAEPEAFASAWARFQELARSRPVSTSDLPTLLLALVGRSAPMQALEPGARWHTLGGQTTSPHYTTITAQGVAHGVDAHGRIFDVSASGAVHPGAEMDGLRAPEDVARASAPNRPAIAFWGSFFRDYLPRCAGAARR